MSGKTSKEPDPKIVNSGPFGWIYKLDRDIEDDRTIPASAIMGMWKADAQGKPTGDFIPNPDYRPRTAVRKAADHEDRKASPERDG